jgi:hypothetical protein
MAFSTSLVSEACARMSCMAALLRLVLECRYFATELPKLYVVTINELLCAFFRRVVVRALKINRADDVVIISHDVRPILGHMPFPSWNFLWRTRCQSVCLLGYTTSN